MEEVNVPPMLSPDDKECEEIYVRTNPRSHVREKDGRFTVSLLFKGDVFSLGDKLQMAQRRFTCLECNIQLSPQLKKAYDDLVIDYLDKGYIVPPLVQLYDTLAYIIPHHGIIRNDKLTSKSRVVLDDNSEPSMLISLNDILYNG